MLKTFSISRLCVFALGAALALAACLLIPQAAQADSAQATKIHFIAFGVRANTDAILIESNGVFGMVDSGEDTDYPDGSDERYPVRTGITRAAYAGHEAEVIAYLHSLGVTPENFEFYIGTHAHSDHIGSADEIIREFQPQRVYLGEYADEYVTEESHLWDNLYVYDRMLEAAEETGAEIIQHFDEATVAFQLGDAEIEIMNYDEDYKTSPKFDANDFSLGVKVTAYGRSAFLAGDIGNRDGDEDRLASQIGDVDVLKLGHHGAALSNTEPFVRALAPEYAVQTGHASVIDLSTYRLLNGMEVQIYSSDVSYNAGYRAIVATLSPDGVTVEGAQPVGWLNTNSGWYYIDKVTKAFRTGWLRLSGIWYYFDDETGRMQTGWSTINGKNYYFDPSTGCMATGWKQAEGAWYYFNPVSGAQQTGWLKDGGIWYFLDPGSGAMQTGWETINGTWYYFFRSGAMATGWAKVGKDWFYFKSSGAMATGWLKSSGKWYFLKSSGAMAAGEWCGGYWLNKDGTWTYAPKGSWKKNASGWWFGDTSGWYAKNSTVKIDDVAYAFDSRGYWRG